jgi:urea transporter
MDWSWTKVPPRMQRTVWDDFKVGLFFLAGAMLGYLTFGDDGASVLLGCLVGVVLMIVVRSVHRRVIRR